MRLIDADALMPKLKFIREAEHQIYGKGSWGFAVKCRNEVEEAPTIEPSAQTEITLESAIDYLHKIGWMQEHDRILTESAQPDYTAIKYEIQRNIDDFYNSKHHAQHVSNNGRMIAFGLELALDIVKDVERREDDK